jgi:hypothetical protein
MVELVKKECEDIVDETIAYIKQQQQQQQQLQQQSTPPQVFPPGSIIYPEMLSPEVRCDTAYTTDIHYTDTNIHIHIHMIPSRVRVFLIVSYLTRLYFVC